MSFRLRRTAPPTKDEFGEFWWVRGPNTHGKVVPVRVVVWRDEMNPHCVGYELAGELGWTKAKEQGVEWYGPITMPEPA